MAAQDPRLKDAIGGWLADGPLRLHEVLQRGQAAGLLSAEDDDAWEELEFHFSTTDGYWRLDHDSLDETVVLARNFLDTGLILTHRATEEELSEGALVEDPDLGLLTASVG